MSFYECVFITRQDLSTNDLESTLEKYTKIIEDRDGRIVSKENWGLRNLAYKINNNRKGNYMLLNIEANGEIIKEMERVYKIDDDIIRYLTTKIKEIPKDISPIMKMKLEKEDYQTSNTETSNAK